MTQAEALNVLKTGANVFLTGEPGSGKTYTINRYIEYLKNAGVEIAVTASTGIAATHVNGRTIHSWAGIGVQRSFSEEDLVRMGRKASLVRRILRAQVLIIDEISMLDAEILTLVDQVTRSVRMNEAPFGGLQVIFVGDFFQLPPVSQPGFAPARFAFESPAWASAGLRICYLDEQHRQMDDPLSAILSAMRRGEGVAEFEEQFKSRHGRPEEDSEASELYAHNADVDRINNARLALLEGDVRSFTMNSSGKAPLVEQLKRGCLSPEVLELKEGALVMFTKNDLEGEFVNGTLGAVEGFTEGGRPIVRTRAGRRIEVEPDSWTIEENEKVLAVISQLPLRLAWAMTVHKSQGMSLDAAIMDLSRTFEYGQGYVALSRVRSLEGIYLLGLNQRALEVDARITLKDAAFRAASESCRNAINAVTEEGLIERHTAYLKRIGGRVLAPGEAAPAPKQNLVALRQVHAKAYQPWSEEEEGELLRHFETGLKIKAISEKMGRQPGGIRARLKKLGKID